MNERVNAMLQELSAHQRAAMERSVNLAGELADAQAQIDALKKRIAEFEKPSTAP